MKKSIGLGLGGLIIALGWFIYYFIMPVLNIKFLFNTIIILVTLILLITIMYMSIEKHKKSAEKQNKYGKLLKTLTPTMIIIVLIGFGVNLGSSQIFSSKKYRQLAGDVKTEEFKDNVKEVELDNIPIIDLEYALRIADKKVGEIPSLGSKTDIGEMTIQLVGDKLYYVAPLEPSGLFPWFKNRGTEGYIMVNAMALNDVKLVTEINGQPLKLKYSQNAYFNDDIRRHAYQNKKNLGLTDFSFEIDDEGKPYWVITTYDKAIGINGEKIVGILVVDAQTGEETYFDDINKMPSWVDRVQPVNIMVKQINLWGKYIHGFWNFSKTDKLGTTEGTGMIYIDGICYYYTGMTSVGVDNSSVGFMLINSRTGEKTFYKNAGATEEAGMSSAEGKVQNLGYVASFPSLININNEPTYFIPLKDNEGLIKQYAMVNVENYNIVGVGNNIEETYNNYNTALNNGKKNSTDTSSNGNTKTETLTVDRIGSVISQNELIFYITAVEYPEKLIVVAQGLSKETPLTRTNDKINISYFDNTNNSINAITFDNININLK
ncbi:cell shape-determining protein [Clostridium sp.]|uniref:cell shape-determining protein n=1 Tax=Clostridium sp. TaxID=1506 RepID=UPI0026326645|nr:cell shape-determining protein [Clostridium sp.]